MAKGGRRQYPDVAMKTPHPTRPSVLRAACAAALVGFAPLPALAQVNSPHLRPVPPPTVPSEPRPHEGFQAVDPKPFPNREVERFISKVSMLQSEEAQISAIASQRTANDQIRTFAEQVRKASQNRDQELAQLAQARRILLPTGRDGNDLAEEGERWQQKGARELDEDYVRRIIRLTRNSITTLEDYAKEVDADPELAAFAQKHLTALQESLRQAEALEKQIG